MTETAKLQAAAPGVPVETLFCSFCLRSAAEVDKLIAGTGRIFICDQCITTCNDYIRDGYSEHTRQAPIKEASTERLLTVLGAIEETIEGKSNQLQTVVEMLRSRGVSWAAIGSALCISRQSAWERFAHTNFP